jgi:hypothetical protein
MKSVIKAKSRVKKEVFFHILIKKIGFSPARGKAEKDLFPILSTHHPVKSSCLFFTLGVKLD